MPVKSLSIKALANNGGTMPVGDSPTNENGESGDDGISPTWNEPFTSELLKKAWLDFTTTIQGNNPYLYTILANNIAAKGSDCELVLGLQNPMQEAEVLKEKANLFTFLKKQLKNANLTLTIHLEAESASATKAYTSNDKMKLMMEQNPSLAELKKLFDLDLE